MNNTRVIINMVDFNKLRAKSQKPNVIEPVEIFRRLPKPPGINDLYTSQAEILQSWFTRRSDRDVVLKLHTGGGKTLVGLLIAQSTMNETREPVLYLTPTRQLVQQTLEKAAAYGIRAVPYEKGVSLNDEFVNANAVMVGTYKALFNGRSKFGVRGGSNQPQIISAVILDDAHSAFSVVRDSFTLEVKSDDERYVYLIDLFRKAFKETDKLGALEDIVEGLDYSVLEIPYWAWHEQLDAVREQLRSDSAKYELIWPLLRDRLHLCHALVSRTSFTITPVLPLVNDFPTFSEAPRRIYMSATIADDSEIVRTFDADPESIRNALKSRSLAGISERMILMPDLMKFEFDAVSNAGKLAEWTVKQDFGAVILVSSRKSAGQWSDFAQFSDDSREVEGLISKLQTGQICGPVVFANRYDGIDLPGDSCRLLIMSGLPSGNSNYEQFRANALYGGAALTRMLAQRIEQGIGRGARGAGDHCVVLLVGRDFAGWVAKESNFKFLTSATRAQLEMGTAISDEVQSLGDLAKTIKRSFDRDTDWTEYHAETLAEMVDDEAPDEVNLDQASVERKALNLWADGVYESAISKIEKELSRNKDLDLQSRGWLEQLAARIAHKWGNVDRAQVFQREAFSHNRNLLRPSVLPPYRLLPLPGEQAELIVERMGDYRLRRGYLQSFEEVVTGLHKDASANLFEQSLADFAQMIGFSSERHDVNGVGPDVLWLLPNRIGLVIEAKSRKKEKNALTKEQHGQLLVASEWFEEHYKGYQNVRVSVHPRNIATKAAVAGASHALTYEKLSSMISDARSILTLLCDSQLNGTDLKVECSRLLEDSGIKSDRIVNSYLVPFEVQE
jgi:replicative superfamily II helicase